MSNVYSSLTQSQISMNNFISNNQHLTLLQNHCNSISDLKKIHAHLIKTGLSNHPIAISRILAFSAVCNTPDINYAHSVFTRIDNPNLFMWNTIIRGFSQSSTPITAILLFIDMLVNSEIEPNRLTYPSLFKSGCGAQLHGRVIKLGLDSDSYIRNSIIHMYANIGFINGAYKIFSDEGKNSDVVAWNSMIMGLSKNGRIDEAKRLFNKMGDLKNAVSWNSIISGCVRNGEFNEAIKIYRRMAENGIKASEFTTASVLNASANLTSLEQGEWIHNQIIQNKFELNNNLILITAIVDMYCKCGAVEKAIRVFRDIRVKPLSAWNSMILGLANNGREKHAIELFYELISSSGVNIRIRPDDVTFLGVLTACAYMGNVITARDVFLLMIDKYKIEPSIKHYNCMVNVLGNSELLYEAKELIEEMPVEPDGVIWGSLLEACRKHGNVEMAIFASEKLSEIDGNDSGGYVMMCNVYSGSGEFRKAVEHRGFMKERQVFKEKGGSLIEVNGCVREFVSGGMVNSEMNDLGFLMHSGYDDGKLAVIEELN